jgi:hypothetical protein
MPASPIRVYARTSPQAEEDAENRPSLGYGKTAVNLTHLIFVRPASVAIDCEREVLQSSCHACEMSLGGFGLAIVPQP